MARETIFYEKWQITLQKIWSKSLSCTISKINAFLSFIKKFKMAAKIVGKQWQITLSISCLPKICSISHSFQYKCIFAVYTEIQDGC